MHQEKYNDYHSEHKHSHMKQIKKQLQNYN